MREIAGLYEPRSARRSALLRAMLAEDDRPHKSWECDDLALGSIPSPYVGSCDTSRISHDPETGIAFAYVGNDDHTSSTPAVIDQIPELYLTHGPRFVSLLGDRFAIALWDPRNGRLTLARDRLGQLPLYYSARGKKFSFASRLGALMRDATLPLDLDVTSIRHYLELKYIPAPRSILTSVHKLLPGYVAVVEDGDVHVSPYWSPEYAPKHHLSLDAAASYIRDHLLSEAGTSAEKIVSTGAFLSGGLDSSAVVAAMAQVSTDPIPTFAVGFEAVSHNELPFARQVASLYSTDHHEVVVTSAAVHDLAPLVAMFDEPYADASALPTLFAARLAASQVRTVYTGDGGDETLGGYVRYARQLRHRSPRVWRLIAAMARRLPRSRQQQRLLSYSTRYALPPEERYFLTMTVFNTKQLDSFLGPAMADLDPCSGAQGLLTDLWQSHSDLDEIDQMMAVDLTSYLAGDLLPKVEVTTATQNLGVRSPFLTNSFVEWSARLPVEHKIHRGETKRVLKHALADWLPSDLIHRRKQGFGVPLDGWLRREWADLMQEVAHNSRGAREGWWHQDTLQALIEQQHAGVNNSPRLYPILMLELWLDQFATSQERL